jgi:ActR/RegA family two-component response regulator
MATKILIVEDIATLVETYAAYLGRERFEIESASSVAEALTKIETRPPAVMLLDFQLPDGNGFEILRHIKSHGLPVETVVITGQGSINLAVEAMREGAFDFVVKPCSADRLNSPRSKRNMGETNFWGSSAIRCPCRRFTAPCKAQPARMRPSSSPAKAEPAKNSARKRCTY